MPFNTTEYMESIWLFILLLQNLHFATCGIQKTTHEIVFWIYSNHEWAQYGLRVTGIYNIVNMGMLLLVFSFDILEIKNAV